MQSWTAPGSKIPQKHNPDQWRTQKISEGDAKFRHDRVTSQINFSGSAEGTTILGGFGGVQVLDNTVLKFFYF